MQQDNKDKNYTIYNEKAHFDSKVAPLILELKGECLGKIPFVISFAVANEDGKTEYVHDGYLTGSSGINLFEDNFEKYILALHGGVFIPSESAKSYLPDHFDMNDVTDAEINAVFDDFYTEGKEVELPKPVKTKKTEKTEENTVQNPASGITYDGDL